MNEDGEINIIYARSDNYVIGMENDIPWDIPTDMQFFKDVTKHHVIIMGRKTYESIGRALPKRTNIVITSKEINDENILTYSSLEAAIDDHQDEDQCAKEGDHLPIDPAWKAQVFPVYLQQSPVFTHAGCRHLP